MNAARALLLCLAPSALQASSASAADTEAKEERNKAVARRVFEEIFNQGKFDVANEIYAPDFKNHGLRESADLKTDQDAVHAEKRAFPDLVMTVESMVAEGDLVTVLWTFRGTHTESGYGGLPATGTKLEMRGMTLWRIVDGKIRDEWSEFDQLGAYSQAVAHVKWVLLAGLLVLLAAAVAAERALEWMVRAILRRVGRAGPR
jgi:steroid delta-isomerase-like uncharacterized protein